MYQQEATSYCVPACVKSVLHYITGSTIPQSSIASSLGTTIYGTDFSTEVSNYLNSKESVFYYILSVGPSQTDMCSHLYSTIANSGEPALMRISNPTGANWHYATDGHCLAVNAIYSDESKIQFADPLGGTQSGWPYFYEKSSSIAGSVCTHLIW